MRGLVKLPALKGGASREGHFLLYCAPSCLPVGRDTALKDGALRGTCRSIELEEFLDDRPGDGPRPISLTHGLSYDESPLIDENSHGDHSDFISIDDIFFTDQEHG